MILPPDQGWILAYLGLADSAEAKSGLGQVQSLVAARPLAAGQILREEDLTSKAPLQGLTDSLKSWVIGKKVLYDLHPDDPITFGVIEL
ncbi:MAG: hypothetical protein HYZ90_06235 [Candidatus Omnitrophica bacterium]|nr:hypothetical protein [Candidatus Omnitrophota bacterium]